MEAQRRAEIDAFLAEHRTTCLWSLDPDWIPGTDADRHRALDAIARSGSLAAFQRAAAMKRWL